jgi:hypothetical protein
MGGGVASGFGCALVEGIGCVIVEGIGCDVVGRVGVCCGVTTSDGNLYGIATRCGGEAGGVASGADGGDLDGGETESGGDDAVE